MNRRYTITINSDAYVKLKKSGRFGESFSDVILRLIDSATNRYPRALESKMGARSN